MSGVTDTLPSPLTQIPICCVLCVAAARAGLTSLSRTSHPTAPSRAIAAARLMTTNQPFLILFLLSLFLESPLQPDASAASTVLKADC
ncbi:MAG: hypothetical protein DDT24_00932 [Chloroflexi bacterium]|nr:hypothetical protein [Chloroflexota bacterium]